MILKRLALNNIRSYTDASIVFPSGSVLLAGDIGSGKSTILLAIEFALFGLKASELSGSQLLRHGKREGTVELSLLIDGKEVLIKRALKNTPHGIVQDAGYIIIDGMKKDATPKELRAIIFSLLGYPRELMGKSKDLVYRYTVYTPQEAMKEILYAKKEERLDILRRVFNVDKYKRIRENTIIILGAIKEQRKELEGFTSNLAEKKAEREKIAAEQSLLEKKISQMRPLLDLAKKKVGEAQKEVEAAEKQREVLMALSKESSSLDARMKAIIERSGQNAAALKRIDEEIATIKKEIAGREVSDFESEMAKKKGAIEKIERELTIVRRNISSLQTKKEQSEETKRKVLRIDNCPLCMQQVNHDHKKLISDEEESKQHEWNQLLEKDKGQERSLLVLLENTRKGYDDVCKKHSEIGALKVKMTNLARREQDQKEKMLEQESLKKELGEINLKKLELNLEMENLEGVEERYQIGKAELEKARGDEREIELEHMGATRDAEGGKRLLLSIEKDITEKEAGLLKLKKLRDMHEWLFSFFMNLMLTMEKHVMLQINREFNELFKNWFSILMEDETMAVRLDDEFSPLIEQNGYETAIENLSGGEKTSVALAYRLSLNKVINDIISEIKTKDILMLDEPTEGFSIEQLDNVREVLEMLRIAQIIIVSHEAKVESFVDRVIRVVKHGHVSRIVGEGSF